MFELFRKSKIDDWLTRFPAAVNSFPHYAEWLNRKEHNGELPRGYPAQPLYLTEIQTHLDMNPGSIIKTSDDITDEVIAILQKRNDFGLETWKSGLVIRFQNKNISQLDCTHTTSITLDTCSVRNMIVGRGTLQELYLTGCRIGTLSFAGVVRSFNMVGGEVRAFDFIGGEPQPILGPTSFRDTRLPSDAKQIQSLRTLRAALERIHNVSSAGLVRAAELRILRRNKDGDPPTRLISWVYDLASNYGNSAIRPLLWFFGLIALSVLFLLCTHGSIIATHDLVGWQSSLAGDAFPQQFNRAALQTITQTFSPLGVFGRTTLVVATVPWIAFISTVICLFATAALGLFVLALRRRIKLDG